jgi:hypothetical protein
MAAGSPELNAHVSMAAEAVLGRCLGILEGMVEETRVDDIATDLGIGLGTEQAMQNWDFVVSFVACESF